jgi:trehalose synthase
LEVASTAGARYVQQIPVTPVSPGLFRQVLTPHAYGELSNAIVEGRMLLGGKTVWNVNSTARGGGVAELLQSLVAYACGAGIDARWMTIQGNPEFFTITKRIHNQIQGFEGDGGELGEREHDAYQQALAPGGRELATMIRPGDIVLLHDPQTAGLVAEMKQAGARVVWRCHVDLDSSNERAQQAWSFVKSYIGDADAYVFSRASFAMKGLPGDKVAVIPPSIDPFTPKNNLMTRARVAAVLISAGLLKGYAAATPYYVRPSGTMGFVSRTAEVFQMAPLVPYTKLVVQISRWDRLKDPIGVMRGFVDFVRPNTSAHLMLAGPEVTAVADDPEGAEVLHQTIAAWEALPETERGRVHLAALPMQDLDENAAIVNALQRWAEVVVQKSLAEGFGLTVSEAMWKARPMVASSIGGIKDQIEDGKSGILLDDPTDLETFGEAVTHLLLEPDVAHAMGMAAQERVKELFLNDRHLRQYVELFMRLVG